MNYKLKIGVAETAVTLTEIYKQKGSAQNEQTLSVYKPLHSVIINY